VREWCKRYDLPEPVFEYRFHPERKWRMDIAWIVPEPLDQAFYLKVCLEIQGGVWILGGHSRGAQMKKDWEKWMAAQVMGWKMAWCEPKDLLTEAMANTIKELLK
jgi:hypothetical protein